MNVEYTLSDCLQIMRRFIDLGEYHMLIGDLLMYLIKICTCFIQRFM